jgi:hypothetical protein
VLTVAVNDPTLGSPGLAGFLVTFALAIATWLLIRSMVGRLRKVRYGPDPATPADANLPPDSGPDPDTADTPDTSEKAAKAETAATADKTAAKEPGPGR